MTDVRATNEGDIKLDVLRNVFGSFAMLPNDRVIHEMYSRDGCWERPVVEFLRERCFPDGAGTYVDAGANIGMTIVPVAKRHPGVACYAFEPEATNYWLLEMNVRGNGGGVTLVQAALSDLTGPAQMLRDSRVVGLDHRILRGEQAAPGQDHEEQRPIFPIEAIRLDKFLDGPITRPLVLKLDVQGHEMAVLRGAAALQPDIVVFEYWPYALAREGATLAGFCLLLAELELVYGSILIESSCQLVRHLLPPLMTTVPWDGKTTTALNLVAARKRIP